MVMTMTKVVKRTMMMKSEKEMEIRTRGSGLRHHANRGGEEYASDVD